MSSSDTDGTNPFNLGAEDLKDQFSKAFRQARSQLETLGEKLKQGMTASKHQFEASMLSHERSKLLERIGQRVTELVQEQKLAGLPETLISLCRRVEELDLLIEESQARARSTWQEAMNRPWPVDPMNEPASQKDSRHEDQSKETKSRSQEAPEPEHESNATQGTDPSSPSKPSSPHTRRRRTTPRS